MHPRMAVLAKLSSIVVHVDEGLGLRGHSFDIAAVRVLINDPDVREWISAMGELGLAPVKR